MAKQINNKRSLNENDTFELKELREMAKVASIYHRNQEKFQRNPNLSHIVHASLHILQFIVALVIEIFHHVHHYVNKSRREENESVPHLPEERNALFFIYPVCMLLSTVFAILWIFSKKLTKRPEIVLTGCFISAGLMLLAGIIEMKHADMYLDLTEISDEELLSHPVFIHNFIMCLLSIFCMTMYLIQGWILFDYWLWIKEQKHTNDMPSGMHASDTSANIDIADILGSEEKVNKYESKEKEIPGELDPIPTLEKFPSLPSISETVNFFNPFLCHLWMAFASAITYQLLITVFFNKFLNEILI